MAGFVVAAALLVVRLSTGTGRRVHAFLDESMTARAVLLAVGVLLVYAAIPALDAAGIDPLVGPGVYSFFLGIPLFVAIEAAVYLRG